MKYLVVIRTSTGAKSATIFGTLADAKEHLSRLASELKYPIEVKWLDDECIYAKISQSDWTRARIVKAERAEYRLVKHARGEEDEERRFSVRNNALRHVAANYNGASAAENDCGEWTKNARNQCSFKLFAVILSPEKGSRKVTRRFDAATSQSAIFGDLVKQNAESETHTNTETETTVKVFTKKKPEILRSRATKKPRAKNKRKLYAVIAAAVVAIIGVKLITTDWQLLADEKKASSFSASTEVKQIADSLSLTRKGKAIFFASQPKLLNSTEFNKTCGKDGAGGFTAGCYYKDDKNDEHIEIYDVGTSTFKENGLTYDFSEYRKSVALHEMLHAAWDRLDENKRVSVCKDLKVLSNQISGLEQEISMYSSDKQCTELFARVGSEYITVLSPSNNVSSSDIPVKYPSLNTNGKTAVTNLVNIYGDYFDTAKYSWNVAYWKNENQLSSYKAMLESYAKDLKAEERRVDSLISQYYAWPTRRRYNTASSAIANYNAMVENYNSYANTYNKVHAKLDSEEALSSSAYINIR